jgi:hypothetical protein
VTEWLAEGMTRQELQSHRIELARSERID